MLVGGGHVILIHGEIKLASLLCIFSVNPLLQHLGHMSSMLDSSCRHVRELSLPGFAADTGGVGGAHYQGTVETRETPHASQDGRARRGKGGGGKGGAGSSAPTA